MEYINEKYIIEEVDKVMILETLFDHYNTTDINVIKTKVKKDIKSPKHFKKLLENIHLNKDECIYYLAKMFSDIFTKKMIEKTKIILNEKSIS